jgi:preprotein translocase subunit SecG
MDFALALVVIPVAVALAVTAMLLVRRRAPDGSYFSDGDRASGVFGVLATGFSLVLGLIVFLAFTSYDDS